MKNKYFFQLILLAILLYACDSNQNSSQKDEIGNESYIQGLAQPIKLNFDTTIVLIEDYFPEANHLDSAFLDGFTVSLDKQKGVLQLIGKSSAPIANLKVYYKGVRHDVPVFASEKVKYHFTYKPTSDKVQQVNLSGNMNGWNYKATPLYKEGDAWSSDLILNQGLYQYRIWEDGQEMMDANNSKTAPNGMGAFNNTFLVGEIQGEKPRIFSTYTKKQRVEFSSPDSIVHFSAYYQNRLLSFTRKEGAFVIQIPNAAFDLDRSHLRIFAANISQRSNDIFIPLNGGDVIQSSVELNRSDKHADIMYFMMVDRFADGNPTNNRPTSDPEILPKANNLGGDISGIEEKITDGYFSRLGINTIWISPITTNAEGAWGLWNQGVRSKFSAYHGYWPISLRRVDNRFGNEDNLANLITTAHDNNMNVILDYVAHHVHQNHPLYKQKPEWTTPLYLPDGTMNTEKWDEHRLTTWFDTFLPTWDFSKPEVVNALTDTAMYWVENYDIDGFRHDATKHISEDFWRALTKRIKTYQSSHPNRKIFQIGETYGSPELISSYISNGQMDAQFDFNLYDAMVDAFAAPESNFYNLVRVLNESTHYFGSHHLMGNITGNQDRARFISYADGSIQFSEDAKLAGWTRDIQNKDNKGFRELEMLHAFLLTTPGIPCIYYGDEIGLPGGNDPDNRRMMLFDNLNDNQQALLSQVSKLIKLRRENMALTYGDLFILKNEPSVLVYVRSYFDKTALVVLNKGKETYQGDIAIPKEINTGYLKTLNGSSFDTDENNIIHLEVEGNSYEVIFN